MDALVQSRGVQSAQNLPFEVVALVLQGGGALGAYQAGVYEALSEAGIEPNWIAGISIGAINAAIIAGNASNDRVDRLREFWTRVTSDGPGNACLDFARGDAMRQLLNQMSAGYATGTPEFDQSSNQRKKVEMRFAHLKTHHRFERMRLLGLCGARDEFHLAATVQNLKTLANYLWLPPPNA